MPDLLMHALTVLLVLGATLRLTRLVTTDKLGAWLLVEPAELWAFRHEMARRAAIQVTVDGLQDEVRCTSCHTRPFKSSRASS